MLQQEAGWVAVLDGDRFLGVLTPESLHAALRRSVEGHDPRDRRRLACLASRRTAPGCASVGSSSSGGTRQTDSSQSAAATRAAEQTIADGRGDVSSEPAACSRPTAAPTWASTPAQTPAKTAPT